MIVRLLAVVAGLVGALAVTAPAAAHGADAPDATNYRTAVTSVTPPLAGLSVRTIEAGARLELANRTGRTIEVLGYAGEPYLQVRPDGVFENVNSPATYRNATLAGDTAPPATADPAKAPDWQRVSSEPVARWHDQRTHWLAVEPPAQVWDDPGRPHRVRDWVVPLRADTTAVEVHGTLDWLPPPDPYVWWAGIALGVLAVGALGLIPPGWPGGGRALAGLAVLTALGGLAAVGYAVAREWDAGADGPGALALGLLAGGVWPLLVGLAALAAAGYALARRPAADFALALAGTCLALFAGLPAAALLARSVAPTPGPAVVARSAVAAVIVVGFGVAAAGALRMRVAARTAAARTNPVDHGAGVGDITPENPGNRAPQVHDRER
ncbi:MAG TPA: hypothetical protein VHN18_07295 [Micromonosporaceae bacterium]|nr:hypothetical protein [Micromonosporaceae bacterium]